MNERIQKLAEQADIHGDSYLLYQHRLEKFAELIVRECGNYMNSRIPGNLELSATVAKMKQHFGIEQ